MKLKDITKNGRAFKRNARYINRRARVNLTVIEVVGVSNVNEMVTYRSYGAGVTSLRNTTVTVDEFAVFVEKTFGGWEDEVRAAREAEAAARVEYVRLAMVAAAREEAVEYDAKLEAVIASGVLTRDEVYNITVRANRTARAAGYTAGHAAGYAKAEADAEVEADERAYAYAYDYNYDAEPREGLYAY
jgi:hypothetical protein